MQTMKESGLMWYLLIYIFVIQLGLIGYLWADASFYILAGINGVALAVGARSFTGNNENTVKKEKKAEPSFVRATSETKDEKYTLAEDEIITVQESQRKPESSESNIEQVKVRFNKTKTKPQPQTQE